MSLPELDWSNFDGPKSGSDDPDRIGFLRFKRDENYRIRPLGNAVQFYKFFIEKGKPSIIVHPQRKDAALKLLSEHSGNEYKPSFRCAIFVLDRSDDNRIKVMEGGFQIFDSFAKWSQATGVQPGHGPGGDWNISVEGDGVGGSNPRKYTAVFLGNSVFSEEERSMIKKMKGEGKLSLENFLPEVPLDQILERAFGVKSETSGEAAAPVVSASASAVAVASEDGMNW